MFVIKQASHELRAQLAWKSLFMPTFKPVKYVRLT